MIVWLVVGYNSTNKEYINRAYCDCSKTEAYDKFNHKYPEYVVTNIIKL